MPELTVVVPTLNERANVEALVANLERVLAGIDYEITFVDDGSTDGTTRIQRKLAQENSRIRVVHRVWRRGLASAVIEGMMASSAPYLAVIDADLQHDESILPEMLRKLKAEDLDIVIATRNSAGGTMGEFAADRVQLSRLGQRLSTLVCHQRLSDPMSGFFVLTRAYLDEVVWSLSSLGFKILVDLVASSRRRVRIGEVGYTFRSRLHGESKLDFWVGLNYLELLADKMVGNWIPVSYVFFAAVGAIGVFAHLLFVLALTRGAGLTFETSQLISSAVVIGLNFVLNNQLTFHSNRLSGLPFVLGMIIFYVACSVGLFVNLQVFRFLQQNHFPWYLAASAGIVLGSVWNYWISAMFVWRIRRRRRVVRELPA